MKTKKITMLGSAGLLHKKSVNAKKVKIAKYGLIAAVFCVAISTAGIIKAFDISGWSWGGSDDGNMTGNGVISTGLGAISLNSKNCDLDSNNYIDVACGGLNTSATPLTNNYAVTIPSSDGSVTGYGWSSNVGAIDFNPQNHCGTSYSAASCAAPDGTSGNGGVFRQGDYLVGWARFVEIAKATAGTPNSGGWDGWIRMNGIAQDNYEYNVKVDNATGTFADNSYAWSNELGYISFKKAGLYGGSYAATPVITLSANPGSIDLETTVLPKTVRISWSVSNATSCEKKGADWTNGVVATSGFEDVPQNSYAATYTLSCTGGGGSIDKSITVTTTCIKKACSSSTCAATTVPAVPITSCTKSCTSNDQCSSTGGGGWHEVDP